MNQIFTFTDSMQESIYSENNFWGKTRNVILHVSFFPLNFFPTSMTLIGYSIHFRQEQTHRGNLCRVICAQQLWEMSSCQSIWLQSHIKHTVGFPQLLYSNLSNNIHCQNVQESSLLMILKMICFDKSFRQKRPFEAESKSSKN